MGSIFWDLSRSQPRAEQCRKAVFPVDPLVMPDKIVPFCPVGTPKTKLAHFYWQTTPPPSRSFIYVYAGCHQYTGAIPCALASEQEILALPS